MRLFLVHHADAVGPDVDVRRPLSDRGRDEAARAAADAATRGAKPAVIWHSGKLRARQTAEAFWKACNPFAELSATRDIQPADPPLWMSDRLRAEDRDVMIVGHFPYLAKLLSLLLTGAEDGALDFPPHGVVALETDAGGERWTERWRTAAAHHG